MWESFELSLTSTFGLRKFQICFAMQLDFLAGRIAKDFQIDLEIIKVREMNSMGNKKVFKYCEEMSERLCWSFFCIVCIAFGVEEVFRAWVKNESIKTQTDNSKWEMNGKMIQ